MKTRVPLWGWEGGSAVAEPTERGQAEWSNNLAPRGKHCSATAPPRGSLLPAHLQKAMRRRLGPTLNLGQPPRPGLQAVRTWGDANGVGTSRRGTKRWHGAQPNASAQKFFN